jgi:D-alanine-D-alanine ligase
MTSLPKNNRGDTRRIGSLGPIEDLERHLPSDWWKTLFHSLYLKTDGDVCENDENTRAEVDLLVDLCELKPSDRILDLACGQGRHALELARRGYLKVSGLDRSRYLIRTGRSRARQQGLQIRFHEGDARRFRLPAGSFEAVLILGNSFGYFDREEDDLRVLRAACRALVPGGRLVLETADGVWLREHFDRRSWEWIDQHHFVCRERSLSRDGSRLISREVVTHTERGVIADQFYGERLFSAEHLGNLLVEAGFEAVQEHQATETRSTRNQDLGMMQRRMILTARSKSPPLAVPAALSFPKVTVLLGDPRLADAVKLGGRFNQEDLETVARLKSALAELSGIRFRYLDQHDSLMRHLTQKPPELVFNLCDEGYRNNAILELHVPALLEMLGVPYTGAGPQCLGLCYDKSLTRGVAESLEIPVPYETYLDPADRLATIPADLPALVKPCLGDSSVGITPESVVSSPDDLVDRVSSLQHQVPGVPLLIQEFLQGAEYSVGLIGNPGLRFHALPVLEVDYSGLDPALPRILAYESKWDPESPYWTQIRYQPAKIRDDTRQRLIDQAMLLFQRLGCRDYARFDFRSDSAGTIKLLEVNPNPGWCWDGKLALMAEFEGRSYAGLLGLILDASQERILSEHVVPRSTAA